MRALVLSAGGMFGAYQAGVWQGLGGAFRPEIVVGTSAGALNAWAIAGGCSPDELAAAWLDENFASAIRWAPTLLPPSLLDERLFLRCIERVWSSYQPHLRVGIVTTELRRLRWRLFQDSEISSAHLAASAAVLLALPPVCLDGAWHCDGGLLGALPLWAAAEMGADEALAINVLHVYPSRAVRWVVRLFQRAAGAGRGKTAPSLVILAAPHAALGSLRDAIFWNPENSRRWLEQGREDGARLAGVCRRAFARK